MTTSSPVSTMVACAVLETAFGAAAKAMKDCAFNERAARKRFRHASCSVHEKEERWMLWRLASSRPRVGYADPIHVW